MVDFIVVGSGIASFTICKRLEERKKSFVVVSDFTSSATSVAGGIINPVVLKRFKLFWNAINFYNEAISFYRQLERDTPNSLFTQKNIVRIFSSTKEQNDWFTAADQPILRKFLNTNLLGDSNKLKGEFKSGLMTDAYLVNAGKLLDYFHNTFLDPSQVINEEFDYSKLIFSASHIRYKNILSKKIIFAEGSKSINNPFFSYLPLYGNRGDYLIFKSTGLQVDSLVKGKSFIIPLGNDIYKYGASFDRHHLTNTTPQAYRKELINSLQRTIDVSFEVIRFESGIRPNVKDRRPVLGNHPVFNSLYIMNGFGSRGIFMSPLLSKWLYDYMEGKENLPEEVDIKRFYDHF